MKKVGIISLYGNKNYGNKLQNYAVYKIFQSICSDCSVTIIRNKVKEKTIVVIIDFIKRIIKKLLSISKEYYKRQFEREENFKSFRKFMCESNIIEKTYKPRIKLNKEYDLFVVGSDQVWNPTFETPFTEIPKLYSLDFITNNNKKISFSASIGISVFPNTKIDKAKKTWNDFKSISVREDAAKEIIEGCTGRTDVEVLLDPTMLLPISYWDEVIKKPKQIKTGEKYILNYFLGNLDSNKYNEIQRVAKENDCKIINILSKNDPFYSCGPSEFLWLEKNAFLICTDSFHSSVFAILYKKPFIVFNRDDGQKGINSMNSRLETLLSKFKLNNRYFKNQISNDLLNCEYLYTDEILDDERKKAFAFLEKSLNMQKGDNSDRK